MAISDLPEKCCAFLQPGDKPILIVRGQEGYYALDCSTFVEYFNNAKGITAQQVECMLIGSMFGWHVPGADPANNTPQARVNTDLICIDIDRQMNEQGIG